MAKEAPDTHAGGVVYRETGGDPEYLMVRPRRDPRAWVLPKGHIEPGETPEQTAVREIEEEAGCHAAIVAPLGHLCWGVVRSRMYLMRFERAVPAHEDRGLFWGSADAVMERLTFEDTRRLVADAHALVMRNAASRRR